MKVETAIGDFVLEPITHGQYNDCLRKALTLKEVKDEDGLKRIEPFIDPVLKAEWFTIYSIKEAPESFKLNTYQSYCDLPHEVGEVLDKVALDLNSLSDTEK